MGTWWSHHADAVISTVVGIIATIFVAAVVYIRQRTYRRLSYRVIARQRLVPLTAYQEYSDLQIQFKRNPVTDPWIVIIRIINTGHQDIGPNDITRPLSIDIGNNTIIRDARVTGSTPENVYEAKPLEIDEMGRPSLERVAINRDNTIQIQLLLDGQPEKVTVVGRGVGIDMVTELQAERRDEPAPATSRFWPQLAVALSVVSATFVVVIVAVRAQNQTTTLAQEARAARSALAEAQSALAEVSLSPSAKIVSPSSGNMVGRSVRMAGTFSHLSTNSVLWSLSSINGQYYSNGPCLLSLSNQTFDCPPPIFTAKVGEKFTIYVVSADAALSRPVLNQAGTHGFTTLPVGTAVLSSVTVFAIRT